MNAFPLASRLSVSLIALTVFVIPLRAGDDSTAARPESVSVSTQMNDYLQTRKITHSVDSKGGDAKGEPAETVTVKIYDVSAEAQQNAICTALAATAKKGRVREATVLFYAPEQAAGQGAGFQASRLPSGNGDAEFARDAQPVGYRLLRTVKL